MALTKYERENIWKSQVVYTSSNTNINCSGNMTFLTVYRPDNTVLLGPESGQHTATGTYYYYVSTQSTDDLGIYICRWETRFDYGAPWNWAPKIDREAIQLVKVK